MSKASNSGPKRSRKNARISSPVGSLIAAISRVLPRLLLILLLGQPVERQFLTVADVDSEVSGAGTVALDKRPEARDLHLPHPRRRDIEHAQMLGNEVDKLAPRRPFMRAPMRVGHVAAR